jgi:hypothetical protein
VNRRLGIRHRDGRDRTAIRTIEPKQRLEQQMATYVDIS